MADSTQVRLEHGSYTATITDEGATLRTLSFGGRDVIVGFGEDELRPHFRGAVLAPWPNRIADGRYRYGGQTHQLEINEPDKGTALHGLVTDVRWRCVRHSAAEAEFRHEIDSPAGYPFRVRLTTTYTLSDTGLRWSVAADNVGQRTAPYGTGPHPYLRAGDGTVDEWRLVLPAQHVMELGGTPEPVGAIVPDFTPGRSLRAVRLDHTFTGLAADASGMTRARLLGADGGVECVWDPEECPWVQVYTYDLDGSGEHPDARSGVAIEPMTCPPFAFNTGVDVIALQPGERHTTAWTLAALPAGANMDLV